MLKYTRRALLLIGLIVGQRRKMVLNPDAKDLVQIHVKYKACLYVGDGAKSSIFLWLAHLVPRRMACAQSRSVETWL